MVGNISSVMEIIWLDTRCIYIDHVNFISDVYGWVCVSVCVT